MIEWYESDDLFMRWIEIAPGAFTVSDLTKKPEVQQLIICKLEDFVEKGVLRRHGDRRGWYIPKNTKLQKMDFQEASGEPVDLWLPFDLSDMVELYENSVVIISGAPNAGKTGLMLNIIKENRHKGWDINYFNSEMSATELRKRLSKFDDVAIQDWNFNAYYRSGDFGDVIFPGKNSLNVIDFLEVHDEFYMVGKKIKEIHDKLDGGIAIIGLQKNPGSDTGLGGFRSMEVARLALAVDYGRVKISKAKNFRNPKLNPNGLFKRFKMVGGCKIIDRDSWHQEKSNGQE